ncbi:tetratricopeptide repeat protein [Parvicella tangerina]|uniref:Tetratricopeptide repeat protein n=1 Tax=Parvicella tangerina TaxID=2829795 RepID=A0A916JP80_9FLAO|nr:tetratricopeptide repeat protein [Parvicella tangerina]CAG5084910.1 hypothetical protein CRYO30217_02598 [Parvicella tangerina]
MMLRTYIFLTFCFVIIESGISQREDKITFNEGVSSYRDGDYADAQSRFEEAYQRNNKNTRALYNAGNAAYLNGKFEEANQYYTDYAKAAKSPEEIAKAYFNQGNTYLQQADALAADPSKGQDAQKLYKKAVGSYKNALKNNPSDKDAKYNLTYALNKIQQEQNQQNQDQQNDQQDQEQNQDENQDQQNDQNQQNGDGEGDNNQDQQSDQNQDEQNDQNQEGNQDDQEQDGDQKEKENNEGDQGDQEEDENQNSGNQEQGDNKEEQQAQISRAQAEQDLDAINEEEENILKRVYGSRGGEKSEEVSSGKDW